MSSPPGDSAREDAPGLSRRRLLSGLGATAAVTVAAETTGVISTDYSIDIEHGASRNHKIATATLGGGGPKLEIRTLRGDIRLFRTLQ